MSSPRFHVIQIDLGAPCALQTQLREECARLWNRLVKLHRFCRIQHRPWPTPSQLEKHFKGRLARSDVFRQRDH